jgi:hypothetical protein
VPNFRGGSSGYSNPNSSGGDTDVERARHGIAGFGSESGVTWRAQAGGVDGGGPPGANAFESSGADDFDDFDPFPADKKTKY